MRYYNDRKAEAVIIEETEGEKDDYEAEPGTHSLRDDIGYDSTDTEASTEAVADTEGVIEMLAEQNLHDEAVDPELRVKHLLAALAEDNPPEVRLQAIYLLADVAPDLVENFLDDKEDLIRYEAERIVGILPEE